MSTAAKHYTRSELLHRFVWGTYHVFLTRFGPNDGLSAGKMFVAEESLYLLSKLSTLIKLLFLFVGEMT